MAGQGFSHLPTEVEKIRTRYRRIRTPLPVPESVPMLEKMYQLESRSMHGQYPMIWNKAKGFQVFDKWGNCWLDFTSTIFVANTGHGNKRIRKDLVKTIRRPLLHSYSYANPERIRYLEYLISNTPPYLQKAFLLSAGTEATEVALKLMRLRAQREGKRKGVVVSIQGNWHGRTLGAQMMGSNMAQKEWIGYQDPNIVHIPFPYPWHPAAFQDPVSFVRTELANTLAQNGLHIEMDIAGFMLETFQGWGAVFYPEGFVSEIMKIAKESNSLVAFDEMQAGFGRTGKLFGFEHYGVEPDIVCCGKGSSSSLPLSIVMATSEIMDLPEIGSMSSTHSANPLSCAAGLANMKALLEDGILENAQTVGETFQEGLERIAASFPEVISGYQGKGLVGALIFKEFDGVSGSSFCDALSERCFQKGLLVVHTGRESVKLAPPLVITSEALLEGLQVLHDVILELLGPRN